VKRIKALVKRCDKVTAAMVLAAVDEQSKWLEFIDSDDERVALKQRGGRRPGAGRKVKRIKALVKRCDKVTAAMVLAAVDEQSKWLEFIESDDERVALDAMKFLTQMRDGRPKQQINVEDDKAREAAERAAMSTEELIARNRELEKVLLGSAGA
jgi:hypothetical protein